MPSTDTELVERIERELLRLGWDDADLVRLAKERGMKLDAGTVSDMLQRRRNPRRATLGKILRLLGIDVDDIGGGGDMGEQTPTTFEEVVLADPTLIDEAKEHLLRQYDLLQRASAATPTNVAALPNDRLTQAAKRGTSHGRQIRARQDTEAEAPDVS